MNATPVTDVTFGLVSVMVSTLVSFTPMVDGREGLRDREVAQHLEASRSPRAVLEPAFVRRERARSAIVLM